MLGIVGIGTALLTGSLIISQPDSNNDQDKRLSKLLSKIGLDSILCKKTDKGILEICKEYREEIIIFVTIYKVLINNIKTNDENSVGLNFYNLTIDYLVEHIHSQNQTEISKNILINTLLRHVVILINSKTIDRVEILNKIKRLTKAGGVNLSDYNLSF